MSSCPYSPLIKPGDMLGPATSPVILNAVSSTSPQDCSQQACNTAGAKSWSAVPGAGSDFACFLYANTLGTQSSSSASLGYYGNVNGSGPGNVPISCQLDPNGSYGDGSCMTKCGTIDSGYYKFTDSTGSNCIQIGSNGQLLMANCSSVAANKNTFKYDPTNAQISSADGTNQTWSVTPGSSIINLTAIPTTGSNNFYISKENKIFFNGPSNQSCVDPSLSGTNLSLGSSVANCSSQSVQLNVVPTSAPALTYSCRYGSSSF